MDSSNQSKKPIQISIPEFIKPVRQSLDDKGKFVKPAPPAGLSEYLRNQLSTEHQLQQIQVETANQLYQQLTDWQNTTKDIHQPLFYPILWIDLEIHPESKQLLCGAMLLTFEKEVDGILSDVTDEQYQAFYWMFNQTDFNNQVLDIFELLESVPYLGGHNLIEFDLPHLQRLLSQQLPSEHSLIKKLTDIQTLQTWQEKTWDTLILSCLLIPHQPSHALAKLYKANSNHNNPLKDCLESRCVFRLCRQSWTIVPPNIQGLFYRLLPEMSSLEDVSQKLYGDNHRTLFVVDEDVIVDIDEIFSELPEGNQHQLSDLLKQTLRQDAKSDKLWQNLGMACFISWLRYFEKPQARRPAWIVHHKNYRNGFIQAEQAFWHLQTPNKEWINQQASDFFGFELRDSQMSIVEAVLNDKDIPLGILPTGGGKSVTFQLPALILSKYQRQLTVVICPLKALIEDQVVSLHSSFVNHTSLSSYQDRVAYLTSNQDPQEQQQVLTGVWQGDIDIVYMSPERLRTHSIRQLLRHRPPAFWVLDEAHTLSQWGTDFRPDFLRIADHMMSCYQPDVAEHIQQNLQALTQQSHGNQSLDLFSSDNVSSVQPQEGLYTPPKISLVTATASAKVKEDLQTELVHKLMAVTDNKPLKQYGIAEQDLRIWRDEIEANFELVSKDNRMDKVYQLVTSRKQWYEQWCAKRQALGESRGIDAKIGVSIVYLRNRKGCEEFARHFAKQGLKAQAYHSRMADKQAILEAFKHNQLDVVVCTNAFGMGIDKEGIHTVIHSGVPNNLESYIQEIGRVARKDYEKASDNFGKAYMLWSEEDIMSQFEQERKTRIPNSHTLKDCWTAIKPVLNKNIKDQWFSSSLLSPILQMDDIEQLNTQIRVALLALERYGLLIEKEQQPAYITIKLLEYAPNVQKHRLFKLYHELQQISDGIEAEQSTDRVRDVQGYTANSYHLPELSVVLGYSVKDLLKYLRELVKFNHAMWQVMVRVRLPLTQKNKPYKHRSLRQSLNKHQKYLDAMQKCLDSASSEVDGSFAELDRMSDVDGFVRINTNEINHWLRRQSGNSGDGIKAQQILGTLRTLNIIKTRKTGQSLFISSTAETKTWLQENNQSEHWNSWLTLANQSLYELSVLLDLLLKEGFANSDQSINDEDNYKEFDIERLAKQYEQSLANSDNSTIKKKFDKHALHPVEHQPIELLTQLNQLKKFGVIEMSRLDDSNDSLFFVGQGKSKDGKSNTRYNEVAYADLDKHYQGRCMRIHLLYRWLQQSSDVPNSDIQKAMIEDYFRLSLDEMVSKYLEDIDATIPYIKDYSKDILPEYFHTEQSQIIQETSRASMVLAGPGSGKTTVVVHRVAYLLMTEDIKPEKILVLAYNRMAVKELKQRLRALVGNHAQGVTIMTFHGLARHITEMTEKDASAEDLADIKNRVKHIASEKNKGNQDKNARHHWMIEKAIEVAEEKSLYYQYIMVDEFQDIDGYQYQLIAQLANFNQLDDNSETLSSPIQTEMDEEQSGYLMVVGDDDQNLYAFRGASIEYIQRFEKDYQLDTSKKYYLLNNYRSADNIVQLANTFIETALPSDARLKNETTQIKPTHAHPNLPIRYASYQQTKGVDMASWLANDIKQKQSDDPQASIAVLAPRWDVFDSVQHYFELQQIEGMCYNDDSQFSPINSVVGQAFYGYLSNNRLQPIDDGSAVIFAEKWRVDNHFNHLDLAWQAIIKALQTLDDDLDSLHNTQYTQYKNQQTSSITHESILQALDKVTYLPNHRMVTVGRDSNTNTNIDSNINNNVDNNIESNPANPANFVNPVSLITYHSAKGMEFDYVYVIDNTKNKSDDGVRPLYVALTRAKKSLTILQHNHQCNQHLQKILRQRDDIHQIDIPMLLDTPKFLTFHRFLRLEELILTPKSLVNNQGRAFVEQTFVKDNWTQNKSCFQDTWFGIHNVSTNPAYSKYAIKSNKGQLMVEFASGFTQRYLTNQGSQQLKMSGYTTYLFYQADRQWYDRAGYTGTEDSHYLIVPFVKFYIKV